MLDRMPYHDYWIGLEEVNGTIKWTTGESIGIDYISGRSWYRYTEDKNYSMVISNVWQVTNPNTELPFIIEWDE